MSHAWASIALRAPCATSTARTQPLLQLFNGYAKSQSIRSFAQWSNVHHMTTREAPSRSRSSGYIQSRIATFSTSSCLSARPPKKAPKKPTNKPPKHPTSQTRAEKQQIDHQNDAKLQPAQTIASHTEGTTAPEAELLTWQDYDPAGGMPLPNGERSQAQINSIFGNEELDMDTGNYVLSVMHWRRMSGALIDVGLDFPKENEISQEQALRGLEYIRTILPGVDENANGARWVEKEEKRLEAEIQARAVKLGIYKAPEKEVDETEFEPEPELEPESQQGTPEGRSRTQDSVLVQVRKANEAAAERYQTQKGIDEERERTAALHQARGPLNLSGGVVPSTRNLQISTTVKGPLGLTFKMPKSVNIGQPVTKAWLEPIERRPWVKYYEDQATIIKQNTVPNMSTFARLVPSFAVLILVLASCYYLSENYTPPPTSARLWPDLKPAVATMTALTGLLFTSFILGRFPPLWRTFSKYMCLVPAFPYAISLVGANFRHDTIRHLLSNTISLWLFGLMLHDDVGRGTFLAIFLASGVFGAYSSLAYNVLRKQWTAYIFGSSGGVIGVVAAACTLHPNAKVNFFGYEVPVAAWVFLALFGAAEAVAAIRGVATTVDHAGHLGGIVMGMLAAWEVRVKSQQQRKQSGVEEGGSLMVEQKVKDVENV